MATAPMLQLQSRVAASLVSVYRCMIWLGIAGSALLLADVCCVRCWVLSALVYGCC